MENTSIAVSQVSLFAGGVLAECRVLVGDIYGTISLRQDMLGRWAVYDYQAAEPALADAAVRRGAATDLPTATAAIRTACLAAVGTPA